jgi:hypothetical protein
MNIRDEVVKQLVSLGNWSDASARVGERAGYRCEYCGLDFLKSPENYSQFSFDHIVPSSCGGSLTELDNIALACKICNINWKARWDPRAAAGSDANRDMLIAAVKDHISVNRIRTEQELIRVREIIGCERSRSAAASR